MAQDKIIGVRVDGERLTTFEEAAQVAGKKVSEWLRDLGIAALSLPPPNPDEVEVEVEIPIILAKRMEMYVRQKHKLGFTGYTLNDLMLESAYAMIDDENPGAARMGDPVYEYDEGGPVEDVPGPGITKPTPPQPGVKRTAAEIAASIPGVSRGIPGSPAADQKPEPEGAAAGEDAW